MHLCCRPRRRPRVRRRPDPGTHRRVSRARLSRLGAWRTNGHNCDDGRAAAPGTAQGHGTPRDRDAGPSWSGELVRRGGHPGLPPQQGHRGKTGVTTGREAEPKFTGPVAAYRALGARASESEWHLLPLPPPPPYPAPATPVLSFELFKYMKSKFP